MAHCGSAQRPPSRLAQIVQSMMDSVGNVASRIGNGVIRTMGGGTRTPLREGALRQRQREVRPITRPIDDNSLGAPNAPQPGPLRQRNERPGRRNRLSFRQFVDNTVSGIANWIPNRSVRRSFNRYRNRYTRDVQVSWPPPSDSSLYGLKTESEGDQSGSHQHDASDMSSSPSKSIHVTVNVFQGQEAPAGGGGAGIPPMEGEPADSLTVSHYPDHTLDIHHSYIDEDTQASDDLNDLNKGPVAVRPTTAPPLQNVPWPILSTAENIKPPKFPSFTDFLSTFENEEAWQNDAGNNPQGTMENLQPTTDDPGYQGQTQPGEDVFAGGMNDYAMINKKKPGSGEGIKQQNYGNKNMLLAHNQRPGGGFANEGGGFGNQGGGVSYEGGNSASQGGTMSYEGGNSASQGGTMSYEGGNSASHGGSFTNEGSGLTYDGSSFANQGGSVSYGGSFANQGGTFSNQGGSVSYEGGSFANQGGTFANQGGSVSYEGDNFANQGSSFTNNGGGLTYEGGSFANEGGSLSGSYFEAVTGGYEGTGQQGSTLITQYVPPVRQGGSGSRAGCGMRCVWDDLMSYLDHYSTSKDTPAGTEVAAPHNSGHRRGDQLARHSHAPPHALHIPGGGGQTHSPTNTLRKHRLATNTANNRGFSGRHHPSRPYPRPQTHDRHRTGGRRGTHNFSTGLQAAQSDLLRPGPPYSDLPSLQVMRRPWQRKGLK